MFGKKHLIAFFICVAGLVFAGEAQFEFFFEPGCEDCEQIEAKILQQLESQFKIIRRDIGVESNLVHLLRLENQAGYPGPERAYLVLNGQHAFGSPLADPEAFFQKVQQLLEFGGAEASPSEGAELSTLHVNGQTDDPIRRRFGQMTLSIVVLAGLLDGMNPCAISTLIFFMSLLAVSKVRNRHLILMGISFCIASFLTYLAIGFGLLRVLHLFSGFTALRNAVEWGMAGLLLSFSFLSFRDAFRFRRSGKGDDVTLQLSTGMKKRIHKVMRHGLKTGHLVFGGLMIGIAVTALESVCTGQVYVPTLVLILKNNALGESRAWLYLLTYNLLFILPLILTFLAVYFGFRTETLLVWSRRNLFLSKTLLGLFFVSLALLFLFL